MKETSEMPKEGVSKPHGAAMVESSGMRRKRVIDLMTDEHMHSFAKLVVRGNELQGVETEQWIKDLAEGREITGPIIREASSTES